MTAIFTTLTKQVPNTLEPADRWRERAKCAATTDDGMPMYDPETWHPVGTGPGAQQQTDMAKAVCHRCPVMDACLRWALEQHEDTGVWGGLDEEERRRIHRRRRISGAAPKPRPTGLQAALAQQSITLPDGHVMWTGSNPVRVQGICYTPGQVAWQATYGTAPEGRLSTGCDQPGCIAPSHLLDPARRASQHGTPASYKAHERRGEEPCAACKADRAARDRARRSKAPAKCGTRSGYQGHRRRGEEACAPCRQANADADRRLRNTGTTKPLADNTRPPAGGARCGTPEGYKAHRRWAEKACPACLEAHQAAARAAADAPSLPTCGTRSGYDTHTARGEAPCRPCTDARERTDWLLRQTGAPLGRTA